MKGLLLRGVAAIHNQGGARDPSGLVGGEVERGGGDILGRPHPANGVHGGDFVAALRQVFAVKVYLHPSRAHRIHADIMLGKVQRHTLRQEFDATFSCIIRALLPLANVTGD